MVYALWSPLFWSLCTWLSQRDWFSEEVVVRQWLSCNTGELGVILRKAIALGVLACVLHRGKRSFHDIGLRWSVASTALALPLFLVALLLAAVTQPCFYWLGQTLYAPGWHPPDVRSIVYPGTELPLLACAGVLLNGFYEEVIVRAYVMTGVIQLTQKVWLAVVISVSIQTSYHFYQGLPMALSHIPTFTLYSLFYARTRCILPVAVAHSLSNLDFAFNRGVEMLLSR